MNNRKENLKTVAIVVAILLAVPVIGTAAHEGSRFIEDLSKPSEAQQVREMCEKSFGPFKKDWPAYCSSTTLKEMREGNDRALEWTNKKIQQLCAQEFGPDRNKWPSYCLI